MGNKIKRTTVFIEVVALTNSTAFKVGETVGNLCQTLFII